MQNYQVGYQPNIQTKTQTQAVPAAQNNTATGATFNIGTGTPGSIPANGANGVVINIMGASVNPNGANINNTYNTTQTGQAPAPTQAYDKSYYTMPAMQTTPTVPVAASSLNDKKTEDKPKKDIVLLTDDYIKTLENYLRNDNPDIKLMGAKEVMKRYSSVKMIGMGILENGWAQGDSLTQQLLGQIQQSKSGYGLDALDAAQAALKTAGQTIKVVDNNPPKPKETKTDKKDK